MNNRVDLHVHTVASDGICTPSEAVAIAKDKGTGILAITDHDTLDGIDEAIDQGRIRNLTVITGVEISTEDTMGQAHVLGYLFDKSAPSLNRALARFRKARQSRAVAILERLKDLGLALDWAQIQDFAQGESIGRPHIARAMQRAGYVYSVEQAFQRYLGRNQPAYISRAKMTPRQAIALILEANGVPVLAHPWDIQERIGELAAAGLAGLEVYYGGYSVCQRLQLKHLAREYGLVATGGSDFHEPEAGPEHALGAVRVPARSVPLLKERWQKICERQEIGGRAHEGNILNHSDAPPPDPQR